MKNSFYDDLEDERRAILKSLFDATFGRVPAMVPVIAKRIHDLGTINRLLGKR
jgi:hypothetical protein